MDSLLNSPRDYKHKAPARLQTNSESKDMWEQFLELTKQEQALMKRQNALLLQILSMMEDGNGNGDGNAGDCFHTIDMIDMIRGSSIVILSILSF